MSIAQPLAGFVVDDPPVDVDDPPVDFDDPPVDFVSDDVELDSFELVVLGVSAAFLSPEPVEPVVPPEASELEDSPPAPAPAFEVPRLSVL
jgi:hypothetical protein